MDAHVMAILYAVAQAVASTVLGPFGGALTTLIYFDLRTRKEGYDSAQLTQELQYERPLPLPIVGNA
jgi:hypothetical protein